MTLQPIVRGRLLVEEVLGRMRQAIVQGDWDLGEKISEARVARLFGVSKTPVREALVQLKREGLVDIRPQAGTFVFTLESGELNQICEVRWIMETAAVRLAFQRGIAGELADRLDGIVEEMAAARAVDDTRRYLDLDGDFHHVICKYGDNLYLNQSYAQIEGKVAALRTRLGTEPHHMTKSFNEHVKLASLFRKDTPEEALDLLARHIARKEGSYWEHLRDEVVERQ